MPAIRLGSQPMPAFCVQPKTIAGRPARASVSSVTAGAASQSSRAHGDIEGRGQRIGSRFVAIDPSVFPENGPLGPLPRPSRTSVQRN